MKHTIVTLLIFFLLSCKKKDVLPEDCPIEQRIGCRCVDGTGFNFVNGTSYSGECDNHGGVAYWHCN